MGMIRGAAEETAMRNKRKKGEGYMDKEYTEEKKKVRRILKKYRKTKKEDRMVLYNGIMARRKLNIYKTKIKKWREDNREQQAHVELLE